MNATSMRLLCATVLTTASLSLLSQCTSETDPTGAPEPFADTLQIVAPNGGEQFAVGDTMRISWLADPAIIALVLLDVSIDSGDSWFPIPTITTGLPVADPAKCRFSWKVPPTLPDYPNQIPVPSTGCMVRVRDYNRPALADVSDQTFVITGQ